MTTKQENRSCRYNAGMVCFYNKECTYPSLTDCLQQNLYLAQKEISLLKEKRNQRHSKVSIKWRNNSFYYKKKLKYLEAWIKDKGIEVPKIEELFPKDAIISEPKDTVKEVEDVELRNSNSEGVSETRGNPQPNAN